MDKEKRLIDLTVDEFNSISPSSVITEVMDIDRCAEFLHKKPQTIYKYVSKGTIPFHRKNGNLYFLRTELLDWIKNGE